MNDVVKFNFLSKQPSSISLSTLGNSKSKNGLIALLVAFLISSGAWFIESQRVNSSQNDVDTLTVESQSLDIERRKFQAFAANVQSLTSLEQDIVSVKKSGTDRANELVTIGNHLPKHVWFTALSSTEAEWAVSGKSTTIDGLGNTILSLHGIKGITLPTLRSATDSDHGQTLNFDLNMGRGASK